ncbi:MAG: hypothetical protein LJE84_11415 [Gammaproteobacteria bacterium]|nr:hypothetical protein [Gammaproteobacteria bacterium]
MKEPERKRILTVDDLLANINELLSGKVCARTEELGDANLAIVQSLARAAGFRDHETGMHLLRIGRTSALIARGAGLAVDQEVEAFRQVYADGNPTSLVRSDAGGVKDRGERIRI